MEFGQRIRDARIKNNLTQDQVAKKLFVTRQTISSWEQEKTYPDIASLIKISDYYHISLDTLLKEDSGMREYLEKKTIKRALKPTYTFLILMYLLLSLILIGIMSNVINMSTIIYPLLLLIPLIGGAVFELDKLDKSTSLGLKYKWKIPSKYTIIFAILSIILGIIFSYLQYSVIGGFFSGIGCALIFFNIINRKKKSNLNKRNQK